MLQLAVPVKTTVAVALEPAQIVAVPLIVPVEVGFTVNKAADVVAEPQTVVIIQWY